MEFVETALDRDPDIQLHELFRQARGVSDSIQGLSKRQFNARYPLQVKRRRAQAAGRKNRVAKKKVQPEGRPRRSREASKAAGHRPASKTDAHFEPTARDNVRQVFLRFATDIVGAEERKDLVKVLANVDEYVDRVLKGSR
jgi:hypothetical protein